MKRFAVPAALAGAAAVLSLSAGALAADDEQLRPYVASMLIKAGFAQADVDQLDSQTLTEVKLALDDGDSAAEKREAIAAILRKQ